MDLRINSEKIPAWGMNKGWNKLVWQSARTVEMLKLRQETLRAEGRYEEADECRALWQSLHDALTYVGMEWRLE